jgi:hypothetical protein
MDGGVGRWVKTTEKKYIDSVAREGWSGIKFLTVVILENHASAVFLLGEG